MTAEFTDEQIRAALAARMDVLDGYRAAGHTTVHDFLIGLLAKVWAEQEDFNGKRPFGNSGWDADVYYALVKAGLIDGSIDEDGYLDDYDDATGSRLVAACIDSLNCAEVQR